MMTAAVAIQLIQQLDVSVIASCYDKINVYKSLYIINLLGDDFTFDDPNHIYFLKLLSQDLSK